MNAEKQANNDKSNTLKILKRVVIILTAMIGSFMIVLYLIQDYIAFNNRGKSPAYHWLNCLLKVTRI